MMFCFYFICFYSDITIARVAVAFVVAPDRKRAMCSTVYVFRNRMSAATSNTQRNGCCPGGLCIELPVFGDATLATGCILYVYIVSHSMLVSVVKSGDRRRWRGLIGRRMTEIHVAICGVWLWAGVTTGGVNAGVQRIVRGMAGGSWSRLGPMSGLGA